MSERLVNWASKHQALGYSAHEQPPPTPFWAFERFDVSQKSTRGPDARSRGRAAVDTHPRWDCHRNGRPCFQGKAITPAIFLKCSSIGTDSPCPTARGAPTFELTTHVSSRDSFAVHARVITDFEAARAVFGCSDGARNPPTQTRSFRHWEESIDRLPLQTIFQLFDHLGAWRTSSTAKRLPRLDGPDRGSSAAEA